MKKVEQHDDARQTSPSALLIVLLMYAPTNQNKPLGAGLPVSSQCTYILSTNELQDSTQIRERNITFTISVEFSTNYPSIFLAIHLFPSSLTRIINNVQTLFSPKVWKFHSFMRHLRQVFWPKASTPSFLVYPQFERKTLSDPFGITVFVNVQEGKGEFIQKLLFGAPKTQVMGENTPI